MSGLIHGATPETWDYFSETLGLKRDLLPVVSNPAAEISPLSTMKSKGKTPSVYNRDHKVIGLVKWTDIETASVDAYKREPDYGICVQTRTVRAIDIDVPDQAKSDEIREMLFELLGAMPIRWRNDSGKQLLVFRFDDADPWPKRVQWVDGGIIEWLGDGQQFVAVGRHVDGELYKWGGDKSRRGKPHEIPTFSRAAVEEAFDELQRQLGTKEPRIARERRPGELPDLDVHDSLADWLLENWEVHDVGPDSQLFITCPYAAEHTTDGNISSTAYFPAGTGGYQQGHFVCLHAHCVGRDDHDFKEAVGYIAGGFDDLTNTSETGSGAGDRGNVSPGGSGAESEPIDPYSIPWPRLVRTPNGKLETSARNLVPTLATPGMAHCLLAHDTFTDAIMIWPEKEQSWRPLVDNDVVDIRIEMEHRGFEKLGKEMLRDCIAKAADQNRMDTAQLWLGKLRWDGVSRVDKFAHEIWGWEDTPYATAVSRYVWSALAGRIIQPGVRADMAPILVGLQGIRKTTLIQSMAPSEDMYCEIRLNAKDDDISRRLRGRLVAELEELRGLNSSQIEDIKAFISRRREDWVPKFKEFSHNFWRRNLFFGTTNETSFLADPTGERRWLPGHCGRIDVEKLIRDRDQYWAEGAILFTFEGVLWEDAEKLAKAEHRKFKIMDHSWTPKLEGWLKQEDLGGNTPLSKGYITIDEALTALHIPTGQQSRSHEMRVEKALLGMGFDRVLDPMIGVVFRRD